MTFLMTQLYKSQWWYVCLYITLMILV